MKKKQLMVLLLAGTMMTGMVPGIAYAEAGDVVEEAVADEIPAEPETAEEAPAEEPVAEGVEDFVGEEEQPAEDDAAQTDLTVPVGEAEIPAAPVGEEQQPTVEEGEEEPTQIYIQNADNTKTEYPSINAAVEAAQPVEDLANGEWTTIVVTGEVDLTETVKIAGNKKIKLVSGSSDASINREVGFASNMFEVSGNSAFAFETGVDSTTGDAYELTVNGDCYDSEDAETVSEIASSIVNVGEGGVFGISNHVTLSGGSSSTVKGAAIHNEGGMIRLSGGSISDNVSLADNGGAVYSNGLVQIAGYVEFSENTNGSSENMDIVLDGTNAYIQVAADMSADTTAVVSSVNKNAGDVIIGVDDTIEDKAAVVKQFTYAAAKDQPKMDESGKLEKEATQTPEPTKKPEVLKLSGKSAKWSKLDRNAATVSFEANMPGKYYVAWVKRGEDAPKYDKDKATEVLYANTTISKPISDLDPDSAIDIYVFAKDNEGNAAQRPLVFKMKEADRLPKPTVTAEPTRDPIKPAVTESVVRGFEQPLAFYPGKTYSFSVVGAGSDNTDPIVGDEQWRPLYWKMSNNSSASGRQSIGTIGHKSGISVAKTYPMYIFFQKYVFNGTDWIATNTVESAVYYFKSAAINLSITPSGAAGSGNGAAGTYGGGGYDYDDTDGGQTGGSVDGTDAETKDGDTASTGSSTATNANTADNTPLTSMMMLASLSLLTGGYVLIRKRKKVTE